MTDYIYEFGIMTLILIVLVVYKQATTKRILSTNRMTTFKKVIKNYRALILICTVAFMPSVSTYAQMNAEQIDSIVKKAITWMSRAK